LKEAVPELEWWDEPFLDKELRMKRRKAHNGGDEADSIDFTADETGIEALYDRMASENSNTLMYVQHPPKLDGVAPAAETVGAMKVYLTKKERKRIRRQTRREREQEKMDKIALGLMPPPEPKMKLSNFMRVLGDQAVLDPSKVEAMVMKQVQARKIKHEMQNLAAKLTPEERREKKRKKLAEDTSKEVQVSTDCCISKS
jgi:U4/U6 small nuclear ribonucleoprotein PRP3